MQKRDDSQNSKFSAWNLFKWTVIGTGASLAVYQAAKYAIAYQSYMKFKKQGVHFNDSKGFSVNADTQILRDYAQEMNGAINWVTFTKRLSGNNTIAPVQGWRNPFFTMIMIHDLDLQHEIFMKYNRFYTKHVMSAYLMPTLLKDSIFTLKTERPDFEPRRKSLGLAFSRRKLMDITNCIKSVTLQQISQHQKNDTKEIDIGMFTRDLQARIICAVAAGPEAASSFCKQENEDGVIVDMPLPDAIYTNFYQILTRPFEPVNLKFPELLFFYLTKRDRRLKRNSKLLRDHILNTVKERRAGRAKRQSEEQNDLLDILLAKEEYQNDETIIDEILGMFVAGQITIQSATTNLMCYFDMHPEIKQKVLEEISPFIEQAIKEKNLVEAFDYDKAMSFTYLYQCFLESLRIEPPATISGDATFTEDVTLSNGLTIPKDQMFCLGIETSHHDPKQWLEPEKFIPERFDSESPYFKTPSGEDRHKFAFNPFLAGGRSCVGRRFAELTVRYTVPLMLYHWDLTLKDPEHRADKPRYSASSIPTPALPMKITNKNIVDPSYIL